MLSGQAPLTVKTRLNSNNVSLSELGDCGLVWCGLLLFFSEFSSNQTNWDSFHILPQRLDWRCTHGHPHTHIPIHKYPSYGKKKKPNKTNPSCCYEQMYKDLSGLLVIVLLLVQTITCLTLTIN